MFQIDLKIYNYPPFCGLVRCELLDFIRLKTNGKMKTFFLEEEEHFETGFD